VGREDSVRGAEPLERCAVERDELVSVVGSHARILAVIAPMFLLDSWPHLGTGSCATVPPRSRETAWRTKTTTMATKELQALRLTYKAAYTAYMNCVQTLSDASQRGEWPSQGVLAIEEKTLAELTFARQALLDALFEHHRKK
jgi:hypothetical protein